MTQLIPQSDSHAEELNERLSKTMFRSTEDFINFYNSGLVNKNADEVVEYAQEVDNAFKNVKLQGKNLVFISKAEVELDEIVRELRKWEIIAKVRDRLSSLIANGEIDRETPVSFSEDNVGALDRSVQEEDIVRYERLIDEKFFRPSDEDLALEAVHDHRSISSPRSFLVKDFLDLDDSFISEAHKLVF